MREHRPPGEGREDFVAYGALHARAITGGEEDGGSAGHFGSIGKQ
jgi:hypothetical protein